MFSYIICIFNTVQHSQMCFVGRCGNCYNHFIISASNTSANCHKCAESATTLNHCFPHRGKQFSSPKPIPGEKQQTRLNYDVATKFKKKYLERINEMIYIIVTESQKNSRHTEVIIIINKFVPNAPSRWMVLIWSKSSI